jgi:hypothetical protein
MVMGPDGTWNQDWLLVQENRKLRNLFHDHSCRGLSMFRSCSLITTSEDISWEGNVCHSEFTDCINWWVLKSLVTSHKRPVNSVVRSNPMCSHWHVTVYYTPFLNLLWYLLILSCLQVPDRPPVNTWSHVAWTYVCLTRRYSGCLCTEYSQTLS